MTGSCAQLNAECISFMTCIAQVTLKFINILLVYDGKFVSCDQLRLSTVLLTKISTTQLINTVEPQLSGLVGT